MYKYIALALTVAYLLVSIWVISKLIKAITSNANPLGEKIQHRVDVVTAHKVMIARDGVSAFLWLLLGFASPGSSAYGEIFRQFVGPKAFGIIFVVWWYITMKKWVKAKIVEDARMKRE